VNNLLSALYYPFSRSISQQSMKQMLLIFESVTFLDPVDDDAWRAALFEDLEAGDPEFSNYRDVSACLPTLIAEGVVRRCDPEAMALADSSSVAAAALSDLLDDEWVRCASNPRAFRLSCPHAGVNGAPLWQMFRPKIPTAFVEAIRSDRSLAGHLVAEGGDEDAWTLSYAAGSAAATNAHLAAAEMLELAPVTDSQLHHELMLRKLVRSGGQGRERPRPLPREAVAQITQTATLAMIDEILPAQALARVTFEDILRFREATKLLRQQAVADISQRVALLTRVPESDELLAAGREIQATLRRELRDYQAELVAARDRLWSRILGAAGFALAPGSAAAVAMNYIGGPAHALAASVTTAALGLLKGALDTRAERKRSQTSAAPAVAYLSRVASWS
jgi:hypothetical protein